MRIAPSASEDLRQTLAVLRPNVVVHVVRFAEALGVDCRPWFGALGLTRDTVFDPHARLSYRQVRTLLVRAIEACGLPHLGLAVGGSENLSAFGLLGLLMMTSATFGEAVQQGVANHEVSGSLLDMDFEDAGNGKAALVVWPRYDDPQVLPFLCEEMIASSLQLAKALIGPAFRLLRVDLAYPAPAYATRYADVLGTQPHFAAAATRVIFEARWLATPLPGHNPLASREALEICQRQQDEQESEQEIVVAVERLLRTQCRERPRIEQVAEQLNLSVRSLRRRLTDAG
ncbi:MAG TPA: AraC family transcriptional regulator, partial [Rhodanobacteraceae bacterium]|nr:AraC family transcriptional regulator [Rhodanobacteraceae bacterium]